MDLCSISFLLGKKSFQVIKYLLNISKTESVIEHKPLDRYLINMHAFHNAHLIRAVLPQDLTIPIAYVVRDSGWKVAKYCREEKGHS